MAEDCFLRNGPSSGTTVDAGQSGRLEDDSSETKQGKYENGGQVVLAFTGDSSLSRHKSVGSSIEHNSVTLSWENVNVFVKQKKKTADKTVDVVHGNFSIPAAKDGCKQILNDVSGVVEPGTLLAILGASGAGKSTLVNVLSNRNTKDYIGEGDVKVNGVAIKRGIHNISAYVQQDDLFFSTLTVRETLTFRALLRMDKKINKKARLQRVEEVIQEMGLQKCADSQVGRPGGKKGISGGESKRLSFGCEILTNPPLLFCDEPTSGLDTFMAQNIVQTLQTMAQKNRTILCTIHQPSSEIFAMFDRVLLLAEGRVAFMGPSTKALQFFRGLNYHCPANFNPADFYILTLAIVPGKETECRKKVQAICDSFTGSQEEREIKQRIAELTITSKKEADLLEEMFDNASRYEASWGRQFLTVLWRSWISLIRHVVLFRVRIMQTTVVSLVLGLMFLQLDMDQKGVMNFNGAIFLLIIMTSFSNMFAVINSFPHDIAIFLREYGSRLYRTDVYFIAKGLAELPTFILLPFIAVTIDYWMVGLYDHWQNYLIASAILTLVCNVAVSLGLLLSSLTADVNLALAIAPPIMTPLMMFGGFFLNNDSVPVYFVWLKYLSWFKYAHELLAVNQWQDVTHINCPPNTTCQYRTGKTVLDYLSFSKDNNALNVGLLFALFAGFRSLAFLVLLMRARRSKS